MRCSLVLTLIAACLCLLTAVEAAPADARHVTMDFGGEVRHYWLYTPAGLDAAKPAPILLVLHGSGGTGEDMITVTQHGFERLADKEKIVVVYPRAAERRWSERGGTVDEAGFLLAVVDKLAAELPVDRNRVFVAGISSGGMMAQRMACEKSGRVAGIATVAGTMPVELKSSCKPERPVPVLLIHGTQDPIVPWNGGPVAGVEDFGTVASVRETAAFWAASNQCRGTAVIVPEPDRDPNDGTRVQLEIFASCAAGANVTLVTVEGGGHTWPGGYQYLPERFIGRTSRDIDANRVIWEFFRR